jgi:hypothetical protein
MNYEFDTLNEAQTFVDYIHYLQDDYTLHITFEEDKYIVVCKINF